MKSLPNPSFPSYQYESHSILYILYCSRCYDRPLTKLYYMVMGDCFGLSKKLTDLIQFAHILYCLFLELHNSQFSS